jgi:uncharacterized protein involved in cysteine biosynthesis
MERQDEAAPLRPGIRGLFAGALSPFGGLIRILRDRDIRRLALVPLVLTSILYSVLAVLIVYHAREWLAFIWPRPIAGILLWVWYVLLPLFVLALFIALGLVFSTVVEIIGGPFFDRMAIRILKAHGLDAEDPGFVRGGLPDLLRSLLFLTVTLVCWLIGLLPGLGLPFSLAAMVISSLGLASSAINPALMVSGVPLGERIRFVFRSFLAMAGMGAVLGASMIVPFLGLVSIPCAVVGAAELYAKARSTRA